MSTGIEISKTAIDLAKQNVIRKILVYSHGSSKTEMPFDNKSYDTGYLVMLFFIC